MGITLESASRLNALKSKIDSAVGSTSSTLSQAVDKAIERGNIQTEEKTFTPTAAGTIITPSSGKYLSKVTVNPVPTMTKTVTPTESAQTYYPDAGKFFSAFTVEAAVASGKKVYTGEYTNYTGETVYIDIGVPLNEEDIFIAYCTQSNNGTCVALRIGTGDMYKFFADLDYAVLAPMFGVDYTYIGYSGTTVELTSAVQAPFKWCLVQ